jgi:hypothetical protein
MAQPKDYIYHLTDEMGRTYYTDANGDVQLSSSPIALKYTPDGWQQKSIKYARNLETFATFRTFTTPLKYVIDSAKIVRYHLYTFGTEAKLYQTIHRLDKSFGGKWDYVFFYRGELDLSQFNDTDTSIEVTIMEGDLIKLYNANRGTNYEIDIDVPEAVTIKHDGIDLQKKGFFIIPTEVGIRKSIYGTNWFAPVSYVNSEGKAIGIQYQAQEIMSVSNFSFDDKKNSTNSMLFGDLNVSNVVMATVSGRIRFKCNENGPGLGFRMRFLSSDQTVANQNGYQVFGVTPVPGNVYDYTFSYNIPVSNGTKLHLEGIYIGVTGAIDIEIEFLEGTEINTQFTNRYRETFMKGLRPAYIGQKLLDKMTETTGVYTFNSTYLSTVWDNLIMLSGDSVRGIAGAKLKLSFDDFYSAYNVPANLCAGIRYQSLYVEEKEKAFQPVIQQALGEVSKLKISGAKEFQYNVVRIGYQDTTTEDVNGRDEFNVTQSYTSPITRAKKTLDLVTDTIASMYEIEITRIKLDGLNTTDSDKDERRFFIHVETAPTAGIPGEPATYYKLLRPAYDSVTGLLSPSTAFNMELHPELCLYRHGNFLHGVYYWQDANNLKYQTSNKNGNVKVVKNGQQYIGTKTISIGGLAPALFIPITFECESPIGDTFMQAMEAGPDGTFSFLYGGEPYYGFVMNVGVQPANKPAQQSTLLCSPVTNIQQLITMSR